MDKAHCRHERRKTGEGERNAGSFLPKAWGWTAPMSKVGVGVLAGHGDLPATPSVRFVREKSILEAVASSLTELFAPACTNAHRACWKHYPFANDKTLSYFRTR